MLMYGKMSFGVSMADPMPSRKISSEITTKVYGRRSASRTIHMHRPQKESKLLDCPYETQKRPEKTPRSGTRLAQRKRERQALPLCPLPGSLPGKIVLVLLGLLETLVDLFPIHHVPPGRKVLGAAIVVLQVVGVLPYVVAQNGIEALHEGAVLIRRGDDLQLAAAIDQPAPAGAELLGRRLVELLLESVEGAEVFLNLLCDRANGIAATLRLHQLPEHRVVDVAAAVVPHHGADLLGHAGQVLQQLFRGLLAELGVLLHRTVEVGDIGLVVLVVMQLHRRFVDGGLKRGIVVRQGRQFESHESLLGDRFWQANRPGTDHCQREQPLRAHEVGCSAATIGCEARDGAGLTPRS